MSFFTQEKIEELDCEYEQITSRYLNLLTKMSMLPLKEEKAREYLFHGAMRRLKILQRCIENIFSIFPPEREILLENEELNDIAINLHAFLVNIFGLLDNLAWVFIYEKNLATKIHRNDVGLFLKKTKEYFPMEFREYLNSEQSKKWQDEYLKNYRDALAHRIPLYVPPKTLNAEQRDQITQIENRIKDYYKTHDLDAINKLRDEQESIGSICPCFVHSLTESRDAILHAQIIIDFKTVEEVIEKFCEML